jgi:hypothetical protein
VTLLQIVAASVNRAVTPLVRSPLGSRLVGGSMTVVTYVGRRSGRSFSLPVGYRRDGDRVTIAVALPDQKSWWRNFSGDGAPIALRLDGRQRHGRGVARRDRSQVQVDVVLDPA